MMTLIRLMAVCGILMGLGAEASPIFGVPAQPVLECAEHCQRFDIQGNCQYRTQCRLEGDCMTSVGCSRFDVYGKCQDEKTRKVCAVPACPGHPLPPVQFPIVCETSCQQRDAFGACLYETRCEIQGRCRMETRCEKFDAFGQRCLSERVEITCY